MGYLLLLGYNQYVFDFNCVTRKTKITISSLSLSSTINVSLCKMKCFFASFSNFIKRYSRALLKVFEGVIKGIRGRDYKGDIAIDEISFIPGRCPFQTGTIVVYYFLFFLGGGVMLCTSVHFKSLEVEFPVN